MGGPPNSGTFLIEAPRVISAVGAGGSLINGGSVLATASAIIAIYYENTRLTQVSNNATLDLMSGFSNFSEFNIQAGSTLAVLGAGAPSNVFGNGSSSTGAGTLWLVDGAITFGNSVVTNVKHSVNAAVAGEGTLKVEGGYIWEGGTMIDSGTTWIQPGATLWVTRGGNITFRFLRNDGTIMQMAQQGDITMSQGANIVNNNQFLILTDRSILDGGGSGPIKNWGTITKDGGEGVSSIDVPLFLEAGGTFWHNIGTLRVTKLQPKKGAAIIRGGLFHVVGEYRQDDGSTGLGPSGTMFVDGNYVQNAGTTWIVSDFSDSTTVSQLTVNGDYYQNAGVTNVGDGYAYGVLGVYGTYAQSGGTTTVNEASVLSADGSVQLGAGSMTLSDWASIYSPTVAIGPNATLIGEGGIFGDVLNGGKIIVGGAGALGTLGITGNLSWAGGTVFLEYDGLTHDTINVFQKIGTGSNFKIIFLEGWGPGSEDLLVPIFYGTRDGEFGFDLPPLGEGLYWQIIYDDEQGRCFLWILES